MVHEESVLVKKEDMPLEISYVPSTFLTEITHVSQALSEVEDHLNAPDLCAKEFQDLFKQEESLKVKTKKNISIFILQMIILKISASKLT